MKIFFCIFFILLFISKTENVFSNNLIYDVNNIEVEGETNKSSGGKKSIEAAFEKAFIVFIDKTLLRKDAINLYQTKSEIIKGLVLSYQVVESKKNINNKFVTIFNIKFDPKKINNFLAERRIPYADISNISLTLFPILVKDKNLLLYEENFFYKNWSKVEDKTLNPKDELISYNLALENIEDLEYINNLKEKIDLIDIKKINSFKEAKNYALLTIYSSENKLKAYLKTSIKNKDIDRSIDLNFYPEDKEKSYYKAIKIVKKEINQIWKEQNLIDVNVPSFLDLFLQTEKIDDFLKLKSILKTIDVIENYSVLEMTSEYSKIRIKYKGKINKIKIKLKEKKINIQIVDNVWKLKIN
jgi:hypothetical protein